MDQKATEQALIYLIGRLVSAKKHGIRTRLISLISSFSFFFISLILYHLCAQ